LLIYFAAPKLPELQLIKAEGGTHILKSFIEKDFAQVVDEALRIGLKVMIDSGAYTAYTQGIEIAIDDYVAVLREYGDYAETYVNLDVCDNPERTKENQLYLESEGFRPMAVFHYCEPVSVLDEMTKDYEYIGIGSSALAMYRDSAKFNSTVWQITNKYPNKFHGFAVGQLSPKLMKLYSADSTTWLSGAKYQRQIGKVKDLHGESYGLFWTRQELMRHNIRALLWKRDNTIPFRESQIDIMQYMNTI
jgi:hypothetical protein